MPRQLNVAREATDDETEIRPLDLVRRVPGGDLPTRVENALGEVEKLRLEGPVLRNRLEAVRERSACRRTQTGAHPGRRK